MTDEKQTMCDASDSVAVPVDFPGEKEGVLKLLPHRDPFVWVSRVLSLCKTRTECCC